MNENRAATATFVPRGRTLSVLRTGTGSGTVTSVPPGISCGSACTASFALGTSVTLTATAAAGSLFDGWGGACTGVGTCTVTMNADLSVTALFVPAPQRLAVLTVTRAGSGTGTVVSNPAGINCGATCVARFPQPSNVSLTATAGPDSRFAGWGGSCSGAGACDVALTTDRNVTATFEAVVRGPQVADPPTDNLPPEISVATANPRDSNAVAQVATGVTGNGVVSEVATRTTTARAAPALSCGFNQFRCYTQVAPGTRITLRARPLRGYAFVAWSGPCTSNGPLCVVVARNLKSVTALFAPRRARAAAGFLVRAPGIRVRWVRSVGNGRIVVSGSVGGPARVKVDLRRPGGGPLVRRRLSLRAGRFAYRIPLRRGVFRRGAKVLPGGFVVSLSGAVGSTPLPFQLRPIIVPAPPEGVVRQSFATTVAAGPPTARLPASSTRAYAYFRFATQPASGRPLTVAWYWPDGRLLGSVAKSNRPEVASHLESRAPIDRGTWVAELRAGSQVVQRLAVRIG